MLEFFLEIFKFIYLATIFSTCRWFLGYLFLMEAENCYTLFENNVMIKPPGLNTDKTRLISFS